MSVLNKWGATSDTALSTDEAFSILSNRRRRFALHALREQGSKMELGALAERVAAWEKGVGRDEISAAERKSVYTSLQQTHLPMMDDADVVRFDKRSGTIDTTPAADELDVYVEIVRGNEVPWHEYYVGLGAVSLALLVALWTDAAPFTALSDLAWASFVVVALLVSTTAHAYTSRERYVGKTVRPPEAEE